MSPRRTVAVCLALVAACVSAAPIAGRVISVIDGDSVTVLLAGRQVKVRLADIDAPEKCQDSGKRARTVLTGLVLNREVQLDVTGNDAYGRTLARVSTPAHGSINAAMIERGAAWVFRRYSNDPKLIEAEDQARRFHVGLWSDPNPMAPWDWRKSGLGCGRVPAVAAASIPPEPKATPQPDVSAAAAIGALADRSERESIAAVYGDAHASPSYRGGGGSRGPIMTGPKGGQYYINSAGNKQYLKR